jgi:hypothetical protein
MPITPCGDGPAYRMLKLAFRFVLTAFRGTTYGRGLAPALPVPVPYGMVMADVLEIDETLR